MARALITGASAGIGRELAKRFARDGHDVILVARRQDRLDALARELEDAHGVSTQVVVADLTEADAIDGVYAATGGDDHAVEFLVNNAGFGSTGAFAELDRVRELAMVQLNIAALVDLTHRYLQGMIDRGRGRILNIASTAGFQPGPYMATYYASKAFVIHFTEAIAVELAKTGVTATAACPGATATEFGHISGNEKNKLFTQGGVANPNKVADHAYDAMMKGTTVAVPGLKNKLLAQAVRFGPRIVTARAAGKLNRP